MRNFWRFLSYNNAVPIALSFLTLSFGAAFASSEEVRESVLASEQVVLTADNTYLVNKDLSQWAPQTQIIEVTEDPANYYVAYRLSTIDIVDAVWKDVTYEKVIAVSKVSLGESDLGLYVTKELSEVAAREDTRLRQTQEIEKKAVSYKVVATEYSGLVGRFLDSTTETLPGYEPVIPPPPRPAPEPQVAAAGAVSTDGLSASDVQGAPALELLGANPARIPVGAQYIDLGVVVHDPPLNNLSVFAFVNGAEQGIPVSEIRIDTAQAGTWEILYRATDSEGLTGEARRTIIVGNPQESLPAETTAPTTSSSLPPRETDSSEETVSSTTVQDQPAE